MDLALHGRPVRSVFDLLGRREPALTAAVAYTLARSPALAADLLADLGIDGTPDAARLEQRAAGAGDRTDIELDVDGRLIIVEAKRGWTVPTAAQLTTYAARRPALLAVVTDCTDGYARAAGLPDTLDGIPVVHRSWRRLLDLVAAHTGPGRRWEPQLLRYLEATVATMQDVETNQVYCVSLGPIGGLGGQHGRTWVERGVYFHPHGPRWPQHPPTYLAFRHDGRLRTIRHVDAYDIVADLRDGVDVGTVTAEADVARPHLVYTLGPHIGPAEPLPYGRNYRAARHWLFLDLLLTCDTYQQALEESERRRRDAGIA